MKDMRTTNIRFNLADEKHMQAWKLLQERDKREYPSYSQTVVEALICLLSENKKDRLDWSALDDHFSGLISEVVERAVSEAVEHTLPSFLAGYMACVGSMNPEVITGDGLMSEKDNTGNADDTEVAVDEDIDFDFLGLT